MAEPSGEYVVTASRKRGGNDVAIVTGGLKISGWTSVRIERGIELCPSSFDISLTEKYPTADQISVQAGAPCKVTIGDNTVVTGYVDRVEFGIEAENHTVRIQGRGKCEDLVDCSAIWLGNQIMSNRALGIAQKLAAPYGITVKLTDDSYDDGPPIPQFNFSIGETAWSIIERICRYRALLAYEDVDGSLLLDRVGTIPAASGFIEGINIEKATGTFTMDERYQTYDVFLLSMDVSRDAGDGGNLQGSATDTFVPRFRNKDFVCEAGAGGQDISIARARWEMARRFGRSFAVSLTTDSWRDSATTLWTPNTLVPLSIPSLKLVNQKWLISSVAYRRDESGTHADLVIMPPQAFQPEPILLQPNFAPEIAPPNQPSPGGAPG